MYLSAAGAEVQSRRLQTLSNNLANVDTAGFKRELAIIQARHSEAIERGLDRPSSRSPNNVGGGVELVATAADFSRGALRMTGVPTDVALETADSFFVVARGDQELLTRAGNFRFSSGGELQTQDGNAVLGDDGPIAIDPRLPWRIKEDGTVSQNGASVARLRVVKPRSLGDLTKVGHNRFSALAPVDMAPPAERDVRPGYLELSTVNAAAEMMELIETTRAFEANVRMVQHHDQTVGALINRVLRQA
jgi:flagellar basal body rod protein FlgG